MSGDPESGDAEGDQARDRCLEMLDGAARGSSRIAFWWRDDDAEDAGPALSRILDLAGRHQVPLALAVVPKRATPSLAASVGGAPQVSVLQHGWQHANHSPEGEKKMELGDHRPQGEIVSELAAGFAKLARLFPAGFVPALVPPWNRIGQAAREGRRSVGLTGLSLFGPSGGSEAHLVNTHLDLFEWRGGRKALTRAELFGRLSLELERRVAGDPEPIGILSHHLVHEEASWAFLEELLGLCASHPAVSWPGIPELFALDRPVPETAAQR